MPAPDGTRAEPGLPGNVLPPWARRILGEDSGEVQIIPQLRAPRYIKRRKALGPIVYSFDGFHCIHNVYSVTYIAQTGMYECLHASLLVYRGSFY